MAVTVMKPDIEHFLQFLVREKSCSQNTVAAYRNDLTQLAGFIAEEQAKGILTTYDDLVKGYLLKLREKRYSAATTARKVASARSFFKFMVESGKMQGNPTRDLPAPAVSRHSLKYLSPAEFGRLLSEAARLMTPEARRDGVMLEVLYATGLRISELVSLNVSHIDCEQRCICVGSGRRVPFDQRLGEVLADFCRNDRLDLLYDDGVEALFLNRRGQRLTRQGFWQIIKGYAARAGLGDKVTPQTLRHSFAKHRLDNGTGLRELQQLLGHAYISSTRIYRQPASR